MDERSEEQRRADEALRSLASKSHLIGLAFLGGTVAKLTKDYFEGDGSLGAVKEI